MKNKIDDFMGVGFITPKGGRLKVVGISKGRAIKYICECSICSVDKELWYEGSIEVRKYHLLNGVIPCGCSNNVKLTEGQVKLLVVREAEDRGYVFQGWDGKYKGQGKTYCKFQNKTTLDNWNTTTIESFLRGTGDPNEAAKNRKLKPDSFYINLFREVGFEEGYHFLRNREKQDKRGGFTYFDYTCDSCSNDIYVKLGLCSGRFTTSIGSLKRGQKACRCSAKYMWKKPHREYQIKEILRQEGGEFISWVCWSTTTNSKFKWVCSDGHENVSSVGNFINQGKRCKTCAELAGEWGYYPDRVDEDDNLYLLLFKSPIETFIKVGRSFDLKDRLSRFPKDYSIEIITTIQDNHQNVYDVEQAIHKQLKSQGLHYTPETPFGGSVKECFTLEALPLAQEIFSHLK